MAKKIISLNVDEGVYSEYLALCKKMGLVMSKQVENFMAGYLRKSRK